MDRRDQAAQLDSCPIRPRQRGLAVERDSDPTPNELQKALFEYEAHPLEEAMIEWTRENWPMAARGMVYARKEAEDTVSGASGVREHDLKVVLETAARVSIAERELLCRAIAAELPRWLEQTYGLVPKDLDVKE
jgi:hypothetical protein